MIRFVCFIFAHLLIVCYSYAVANYGPFQLTLSKASLCKGPKRVDCAMNAIKILNDTVVVYDMNVTKEVKDVQGNMFAISENKHIVRLQLRKLCDHPFWLSFMKMYVNITKDCVILKGNYRMTVDAQALARKYYGGSFVYGKYTFRSVFHNNICNFGCSVTSVVITPQH